MVNCCLQYVDFVGEYHLNLLTQFKALPIIVPRVADVLPLLDSLAPIHGLLLTEGEDIGPDFASSRLDAAVAATLAERHASDSVPDRSKDRVEFKLVRRCLRDGIPMLAICRGSQLVNLACGGELFNDVTTELNSSVRHIDYDDYDGYRHAIDIVPGTPLSAWFGGVSQIQVNSYHHQGVKRMATRFRPMAFAPDGLIEAYFDPAMYNPSKGRFLVGLQFHPERMQDATAALADAPPVFEHPGCVNAYAEFVVAATAFRALTVAARRRLRATQLRDNPSFSKDEISRIMRSGATVHGARLVRSMLDDDVKENVDGHLDVDGNVPARAAWKRLLSRLTLAERGMRSLKRPEDLLQAQILLDRLCQLTSVDAAPPPRENSFNSLDVTV